VIASRPALSNERYWNCRITLYFESHRGSFLGSCAPHSLHRKQSERKQNKRGWFRDGGIRDGTRSASGRLAEMATPWLASNGSWRNARIGSEAGLERFQAQPKWEMSVQKSLSFMKTIYFLLFIFPVIHEVAFSQQASLMLNEINPNISGSNDLIELIAVNGGSLNGLTIQQAISPSPVVLLATLPPVIVALGDIIVVHLNPATATGAAPASETTSKSQYQKAAYFANYDAAWDFHGSATGLTFGNRVIVVISGSNIQDAVAFTNNNGVPTSFPQDVQYIQTAAQWFPSDCGGVLCSYSTTPTVEAISVNWQGVGTSAAGNSVQRLSNTDTNTKTDWSAATAPTWGVLNSGQSPPSGGVLGDYNGNDVVDAADYGVWRKAQSNGATSLPNRSGSISGPVGQADYNFWRSRFGATSGSGAAIDSSTVPEPATVSLLALAAGICIKRRRTIVFVSKLIPA
jgi:hypothetical protein